MVCCRREEILDDNYQDMEFYDLSINSPQGKSINMVDFKNKVILIVNTATKCGFTPQFAGLEILHQKYKDRGLVVLGFPCNQFGGQQPEEDDTVEESCRNNFGVSFQLTTRVEVNGPGADPIFVYLKNQLSGRLGKRIKWKNTKFLIATDGEHFKRYSPMFKHEKK